MQLSDEHVSLLTEIKTEWNRAEADNKAAEQVTSEVVFPSVKELRYGGRRIVDAIHLIVTAGDAAAVADMLQDAKFNCHKARHDAVDAATSKIAIQISLMTDKIGYENILPVHPGFAALVNELNQIREKIVASRKDRENRELLYSSIETTDFPALIKSYNLMMASEPIMVALAKKNRWNAFFGRWGFITGMIALILAIIFWLIPSPFYPR